MSTSATLRFCSLAALVVALQVCLPESAHAGDVGNFFKEHAAGIVTAVVVGVVVTAAVASMVVTVGASTPLAVYAIGAGVGLAAGLVADSLMHPAGTTDTKPGATAGTPPGAGTGSGSGSGTSPGDVPVTGTPVGIGTGGGTPGGTTSGGGTNTLTVVNSNSGGGGDKNKGPSDKKPGGDGSDPQFQSDDSKSRWGLRGPNTPFFSGNPTGKDQGSFAPGDGFKGGMKMPNTGNVRAGCVTDPHTGKCIGGTNPVGQSGNLADKGPAGLLETMGGIGSSRGSGGGSPSLGSMLTGADKPAGFQEFEKRAAEDMGGQAPPDAATGEVAPGAEPPPEDLKPDGMDLDKKVPVMGEKAAPGDEEQRKAAELLDKAKAKISARDYKGAIEDLTEAIKLAPKNPLLYATRAMAYNLSGNFAAAEKDALASIALDPENPEAWVNLAWAQMKQGKLKEALDSATRALKLDPRNAFAYAIRAFVREKLGDGKGALDDIKRAASLDSRFVPFYQRGMRGQQIYDPNADYSPFFMHRGRPAQKPAGPMWPVYLGLGLLLLSVATAGALAFFYSEGRKRGSVKNFQEFLAAFKQH